MDQCRIKVRFTLVVSVVVILLHTTNSVIAFSTSIITTNTKLFATTRLYSSNDDRSGGLVQSSQGNNDNSILKTQLLNAFTNLGTADQYDAVLTGLCAKILDDTTMKTNDAIVAIQDCMNLLNEMNTSRIMASSRSLMALIDATVKTQSALSMAQVIRLCIRNSGKYSIQQYGLQQRDIRLIPSNYDQTRIVCPDGIKRTGNERLQLMDDIPTDERFNEIISASVFGGTVITSEIINLSSVSDSVEHIITSLLLTILISITIIDNGYDVIKMGSQLIMSQIKIDNKEKFQLPEKNVLPFNLGQGMITGSIVRGFTRLLTIDTIRESQCEAAALYTAYVLGLPCFAYRPNAYEASVLVAESATKNDDNSKTYQGTATKDDIVIDNLLTSSGILRILIWLYAPVVIEYMNHPQLIVSDPREANGFLQRLEDYYGSTDSRLFWINEINNNSINNDQTQKDKILKWAYIEADVLVRSNKQCIYELSDRLASGAATIGDCVAVIEGWE